jgi:hypothetical protein
MTAIHALAQLSVRIRKEERVTMIHAITPRNKEGQVHYWQPDSQGGDNQ